jgi:peptidyl-prolyl cis-trans isomerase SurA
MKFSRLSFLLIASFAVCFTLFSGTGSSAEAQQREVLDKIVAVVNDQIILKSEVDGRVAEVLSNRRNMQYSDDLWYQMLENMIDNNVLHEQAQIDSIVVSQDEVSRALDQRIDQLIQQVGSEEELEEALGQPLIQVRSEFRDTFRRELMVDRVRTEKQNSVRITRPEVEEYFNEIPADSLPVIPETVELSHIVALPPVRGEAEANARSKAEDLRRQLLDEGADFEALARAHSDGPGASRGGRLPMVSTNDLIAEYAAAAAALEPGEISEVVRTRAGFHIIRLNERQGDRISTNQILIEVSEEEVDEEAAVEKLSALRDSVLVHGEPFREMARRHSEDPNTAPLGGRLTDDRSGQRRLVVSELDRSLNRAIINLDEEGEVSQPVRFTLSREDGSDRTAYRIVRLNKRIPEHRANLEQDYSIIENSALQRKQFEVMEQWLEDLREEVFVEYRIDSPYASTE